MPKKSNGAAAVADSAPNPMQQAAAGVMSRAFDSLENFATGLGMRPDKKAHDRFQRRELSPVECLNMYEGDWIARKVVDIPAFDMTRAGREWKADKKQIEAIEAEEDRLGLDGKLFDVLANARCDGGAVIVLGLPGDPASEAPKDTSRGQLEFIHVLAQNEIGSNGQLNFDVASPYYGQPEMWTLKIAPGAKGKLGQARNIHPSRVVRFLGARAPSRRRQDPWGNSVLQHTYDAIHHAALTAEGVASLVHEAKVDIMKVPGLTAKVADAQYADRLTKRYALAAMLKSIMGATLVDSEEEWEQKTVSFSQLPELIRVYLGIVSGAADIPTPRMLGEAPGGLNSTGDNDVRNYYDRISSEQRLFLKPQQSPLMERLIPSALGSRPPELWYQFRPLWQLSEKERSENFSRDAASFKSLAEGGLIPLDALAKAASNKISDDGYLPGYDEALEESETPEPGEYALGKEEEAKMAEEAANAAKAKMLGAPGGQKALPAPKKKVTDAAPRTLYVRRNLVNGKEFLKWAKAQGFDTTLAANDLHVTIAFSREPVDWMKVGADWADGADGEMVVSPGGARIVEPLGPKGAVVLLFNSSRLGYRHEAIKRAGASWDWPEYQPHVTITYQRPEGLDLATVEPYRGKLVFGPEIFEEVVEDWEKKIKEA